MNAGLFFNTSWSASIQASMTPYPAVKVAVWIAVFILPHAAQGAGFDCEKASTNVERRICSNPELSEADTKLSMRYVKALADSSRPSTLKRLQLEWLRQVRNRCADDACLRFAYLDRIQKFEWATKTGKKNPFCEELRAQQNRKFGLAVNALELEETTHQDASHAIRNIDVDGDHRSDLMLLFLTGSASLIPPDESSFSLILSSTKKEYKVQAQRLFAISYQARYYLLTRNFLGEEGPVASDVYRLDRSGPQKICTFECGLPDGNCAVND